MTRSRVSFSHIATLVLVVVALLLSFQPSPANAGLFSWIHHRRRCFGLLGCFLAKHKTGEIVEKMEEQFLYPPISPKAMQTKFYVYTPKEPNLEAILDPEKPETFNAVNINKTVAIIIHGYTDNYKKVGLVGIKNALLKYTNGEVGTVVMVDWSKGSDYAMSIKNFMVSYAQSVANIQLLARQIVNLVDVLRRKQNLNPKNVYLVGHSLGAQTAGLAGKWAKKVKKWRFGRITGLDPAGPMFIHQVISKFTFLRQSDADFVDIVHTSSFKKIGDEAHGRLGFPLQTGDVDFFPNGGESQPQCPAEEDPSTASCIHQSALAFYEVSLNSSHVCNMWGYPAPSWKDFEAKDKAGKLNVKDADSVLGYWAYKHKARGARYLKTYPHVPFCKK